MMNYPSSESLKSLKMSVLPEETEILSGSHLLEVLETELK